MPCPPDYLVTPAQLSRYSVPSSFLAQFAARPFLLKIDIAGALGVMAFSWQISGDSAWSGSIVSSAGTTWDATVDEVFADLTFAAGTYVVDTTYTVDANGTVTPGGGAIDAVTASLFDVRANACSAVTTEALTLMQDAVRQPLVTWGDDVRTHAAAWVFAILKRGKGATPQGAGEGDSNIFLAEDAARKFFAMIGEKGKPASITDTSVSSDGPMIAAYPSGDTARGW